MAPFRRRLVPRQRVRTLSRDHMKFGISMFRDVFLGSGVPLGGDPITAFQNVPVLGLRTGTVLDNCKPMVRDVVKARFIATNCGDGPLDFIPPNQIGKEIDHYLSEHHSVTLLPGESFEYSVFRSWDIPGEHQLTLTYAACCPGLPFARLVYPPVAILVRPAEASKLVHWFWYLRAAANCR